MENVIKERGLKMIYVIHHNDADGFGAAYSAWLRFGNLAEYIPIDHGWDFPNIEDNSTVYILDFSISKQKLDDLSTRNINVKILDHHKSAYELLKDDSRCFFDMNRSGAGIAFDYFHPGVPRPDFVNYIEDQDLWRFRLPNSEHVRDSLTLIPLKLQDFINGANVSIEERIQEGKIVGKQIQYNIDRGIEYVHVVEVDEFKMLVVNVCLHQSNYGNALLKNIKEFGCDFAGVYYRVNDRMIKFSLRSNKDFDVSSVCRRFGGGGHFQAAGFEIPLEKFDWKKISSKG